MMGEWVTVVISAGTRSNTLAIRRIPSLRCILATDIACLNREENVLPDFDELTARLYG